MLGRRAGDRCERVVMLLENNSYPDDVRVRCEAESLARAGHQVCVIAPGGPGQACRETVADVRVVRYRLPRTPPTPVGFVLEYLIATLQLHVRGAAELLRGASILHLHNPPDSLFLLAAFARALRRQVVYDQHDLVPELFRVKFGESWLVALLELMERATYRLASLVIAPNASHRAVAIRRGRVPVSRVTVVRNGPLAHWLARSANRRPGTLRDPHLVFLGSMESQDGVDALPDLLRELAERHDLPNARLTMIGDGSRREAIGRALAIGGAIDRVTFTGQLEHDEVLRLLKRADICVDPAERNELNDRSTMVKIAEYMAAGKPIVAHRLTETEFTAAQAALYSPSNDAAGLATQVARLAREPELRAELGRVGLERAQALTWERSEEALLDAYRRLSCGRPRRSARSAAGMSTSARSGPIPCRCKR
jgi:glycosyltransferase involved in cell wall biosynthesis